MEKILIQKIYTAIRRLIGLHRKLLDAVRAEKSALVEADLRQTQEMLALKESLLAEIQITEQDRVRQVAELAAVYQIPVADFTLSAMVLSIQGNDLKVADQFRAAQNALSILVKHIVSQNRDNGVLIERSLQNLEVMKRNVLTELEPQATTYSAAGRRVSSSSGAGPTGSRLLSREA